MSHNCGCPRPAFIAKPTDVNAMNTFDHRIRLRRSRESAKAPPANDPMISGISCAKLVRPTASDDRVIKNTCNGTATAVSCVPVKLTN